MASRFRTTLAAAMLALAGPVAAQETWSAQVTPYVWAVGLGGEITPFAGAPTVRFDKSFGEVLEDSDGAFFLSGFARKGRLVLLGDVSHSSSSSSGVVPPGLPADGSVRQTSVTLLAGYRAVSQPGLDVDLLGGARLWDVRAAVQVAGGALQRSASQSFADPILAVRAHVTLAPRWSAVLYADAGGFGVGSESTAQLLVAGTWQVNDRLFLSGGYRHLQVDYRRGGTRVDVTMAGPVIGVTWRF